MKSLFILFYLFATNQALALPVNFQVGDIFQGDLYRNEHPTGKKCTVSVWKIANMIGTSSNCVKIDISFNFGFSVKGFTSAPVTLFSSISNSHLPEYPLKKTCGLTRDGSPLDQSIYNLSDEQVYVRILAGDHKSGFSSFDYFLIVSPEDKLPISARLHRMTPFIETNYDCENLKKFD
jgi:hypothetical protein